jgi:hypothetical protein
VAESKGRALPPGDVPAQERSKRADLWEAGADERERLADERERLADERETLADERDRLADRQEQALDRREADRLAHTAVAGADDDAAEAAATQAAVRCAEAAVRRAEAELERTRQAALKVRVRAARRVAGSERATSVRRAEEIVDAAEREWSVDRRDFVAAERDRQAEERDTVADRRDEAAGLRERLADGRDHELMDRERRFDQPGSTGHRARAARLPAGRESATDRDARADGERRRERAAAGRRAATQDRDRAAAAWGPQEYGPTLLASFAPFARQLFGTEDLRETLAQVLKFTVATVAGCDCASVTLYQHGTVIDAVASDALAAELDDLQFMTGLGPGPEAVKRQEPVNVADLADTPRWPVLAAAAAHLGVVSALCHGLFVHRQAQRLALGAFTLYGTTYDAFNDEDQEFTSILAAYMAVAVAMANRRDEVERREAALHRGLSTRDVIGQAKGILMERQRLSAGDAFDLLRRVSQRLNRKLSDVARHLAETGEIPT